MGEKTTIIGDYLGTIEEFVPGEGTYADDGKIYASNIGKAVLDQENHTARVDGKSPSELKVGQVIFGEVLNIRKNIVTVIARKVEGVKGEIDVKMGIYVSNISNSYVEKPDNMFGIGDIVKGKVIKIEPGMIDLSTKGDFGVVKAFCKRCRYPLEDSEKSEGKLVCPSCGHKEQRKVAGDYGNVAVI
jgi:exosome complex component CSL4